MSGTDLEKLNIILAARDREFTKAMDRNIRRVERFAKRSERHLSNVSRKFDAMGFAAKRFAPLMAALGAGAIIGKLRRTAASLDDIGKTADKIGLTTDALQELRSVAESAGVSQSSLDSSMERFNKRLGEATMGGGAAAKMLKALDLEAGDLVTMGLDDALSQVADKIAAIPEPAQRAAAAAALFGREGVAMVNLMREGSAGMETMRQEARDLGIVIDESLIRGAEESQTQLDLMSRVISSQLNSALIDMAPLLVGGATAIADFVRGMVAAINATKAFLNPQSDLEKATENLVDGMADEIRQSQLLEAALGKGANMSVAVAKTKLSEAQARHQNVQAIIAEHRALALGSSEYQDLTDTIQRTTADIEEMESVQQRASDLDIQLPGMSADDATHAANIAAAYGRLMDAMNQRHAIDLQNEGLNQQLERTAENITTLQTALDNAEGGVVSVEGTYVSPLENSPKQEISRTGSAAQVAIPDLSDYAEVMARINGVFGDVKGSGDGYADTLAKLQVLYDSGALSADQYEAAVGAVGDRFQDAKSKSESLRSSAINTLSAITTRSSTASEALANLAANWASMFANAAFGGLLKDTGIFDGLGDLLSFDGGGYTGDGPRSGGLDGKGGRMAVIHPQESIIDHTKGQGGRAGGSNGSVHVSVGVDEGGNLIPIIKSVSGNVVASAAPAIMATQDRKTAQNLQNHLARQG
ncbi:hypothetical protein DL239_20160 [Sedimentitalea sp. CY04]|uniref:Uncharacterized protein n=1 Tax=Parasedimentitalea denitrificans TaxID=2211118 RepID=A0ABX0WFZ7_9RHOB|nr:hypothetical protein [Sedimentitalea sp. CY04]NIZ63285.1 hypothetical protein [Sedimentitalea sp. CY04]